jgi:hypothetical protein
MPASQKDMVEEIDRTVTAHLKEFQTMRTYLAHDLAILAVETSTPKLTALFLDIIKTKLECQGESARLSHNEFAKTKEAGINFQTAVYQLAQANKIIQSVEEITEQDG